jgi:hypothetical protein
LFLDVEDAYLQLVPSRVTNQEISFHLNWMTHHFSEREGSIMLFGTMPSVKQLGDNNTFLISEPTFEGSPSGVDFFERRRRNQKEIEKYYDYDPFGVLVPLVNFADGVGFFHCKVL